MRCIPLQKRVVFRWARDAYVRRFTRQLCDAVRCGGQIEPCRSNRQYNTWTAALGDQKTVDVITSQNGPNCEFLGRIRCECRSSAFENHALSKYHLAPDTVGTLTKLRPDQRWPYLWIYDQNPGGARPSLKVIAMVKDLFAVDDLTSLIEESKIMRYITTIEVTGHYKDPVEFKCPDQGNPECLASDASKKADLTSSDRKFLCNMRVVRARFGRKWVRYCGYMVILAVMVLGCVLLADYLSLEKPVLLSSAFISCLVTASFSELYELSRRRWAPIEFEI